MELLFWLFLLLVFGAVEALNKKQAKNKWAQVKKANDYLHGLQKEYSAPESMMSKQYAVREALDEYFGDDPRYLKYKRFRRFETARDEYLYYAIHGNLPFFSRVGDYGLLKWDIFNPYYLEQLKSEDAKEHAEAIKLYRELFTEALTAKGFPEVVLATGTPEERKARLKELGLYYNWS